MRFVKEPANFMVMNKMMVEVAYAKLDDQRIIKVLIEPESTILEVINQSGILMIFPEIDLNQQKVGIFSKVRDLSYKVKQGDRIEIYRPLKIDPKEARRSRARMMSLGF